ncbi:MAG: hypothetical protein PW792_12100 [Acidobacteriaceae bacterium]|nr:hypothetical protein [Acidobacteriaceae bacterium]
MSRQRRLLAAQAGALAAMSGSGPLLLRGHPRAGWLWAAVMLVCAIRLIVLMVRVRRTEGCA